MKITLTWYGTSTFELRLGDTVVFLDAYLDRAPEAPPNGLSAGQVERADFIAIGHSHFDHLWGAETIARRTGATIVGSFESVRLMADEGIPDAQLMPVQGGEPVQINDQVRMHVFPSLHACLWARPGAGVDECMSGGDGLSHQERLGRMPSLRDLGSLPGVGDTGSSTVDYLRRVGAETAPRGDGGALAYLFETADGRIWWNDTSGHWTGIAGSVGTDVAIVAAAGRPNVDGDAYQGSMAGYIGDQVERLRPRQVVYCHHDNWMPPMTRDTDVGPITAHLKERHSRVDVLDLPYTEARPILTGL
jgi:L-ascorbate metabolism protein UlaG (beta-lactamase superfamily)